MHRQIVRLLDPGWVGNALYTGTQLIGFSAPPLGGIHGNTNGNVTTLVTSVPGDCPGGSTSIAPMALTAGVANWAVIYGSFPFTGVPGATVPDCVQQRFQLDGVQLSGPWGT